MIIDIDINFENFVVNLVSIIGDPNKSIQFIITCLYKPSTEKEEKSHSYEIAIKSLFIAIGIILLIILLEFILYFRKYIPDKSHLFSYIKSTLICSFITL